MALLGHRSRVSFVCQSVSFAPLYVHICNESFPFSHWSAINDPSPPQHLLAPPNSYVYLAMRDSLPPEEVYDRVRIVAYDRSMEEGRPLEAAAAPGGTGGGREPDVTTEEEEEPNVVKRF